MQQGTCAIGAQGAIGYRGYGIQGVWDTWTMGDMDNGAQEQWGTWCMEYRGMGYMDNGAQGAICIIKEHTYIGYMSHVPIDPHLYPSYDELRSFK